MRRYDIDWLRIMAIGLLLIYHIAIVFQPWGIMIGFIQSDESLSGLWLPMRMLNVWRIPLLFYVSGMGVYFAMRKRDWKALITERAKRILVPLIVGVFVIVPIHIYVLEGYYDIPLAYKPDMGHLWFLANIFSYVIILSPVIYMMKKWENSRFHQQVQRLFSNPLGLALMVVFFVAEVMLVEPAIFELYARTWHGYFLGFLAFFFGFTGVYAGEGFWKMLLNLKWGLLIVATLLFGLRIYYFDAKAPGYLLTIESNLWIFTVFGFGYRYLQKPGKALTYLSEAAYPVYIWHMVYLYLGAMWILPMSIPVEVKFLLIVVFTFAGCMLTFELIRRIRLTRLLFGMKLKKG